MAALELEGEPMVPPPTLATLGDDCTCAIAELLSSVADQSAFSRVAHAFRSRPALAALNGKKRALLQACHDDHCHCAYQMNSDDLEMLLSDEECSCGKPTAPNT